MIYKTDGTLIEINKSVCLKNNQINQNQEEVDHESTVEDLEEAQTK